MKTKGRSLTTIQRLDRDTFATCAPAKLNISLSIGPREPNTGMHHVSGVMQTISLHDYITLRRVKPSEQGPEGYIVEKNIVDQAISELSRIVGKPLPCRITISKSIPAGAGMGGGSSDAAAALRLADTAFNLNLDTESLEFAAQKVGNDVSFLLHGGRAHVAGIVEHTITPMEVPRLYYLVARPNMFLSTKVMYEQHDLTGKSFTRLASELCPETGALLETMRDKSVECGVTGKGPTVFASYNTYTECRAAMESVLWLRGKGGEIFLERSVEAFA